MKKFDDIGNKLCEYQANLFELSTSYLKCSSLVFVKQFMSSDIAQRMDRGSFIFESLDTPGCLDELGKEKKLLHGKEKIPGYILKWIGYMYRYISYTREVSSSYLFSLIKTRELYSVYEPYHSLDPEAAAIRILEAAGQPPDLATDKLMLAKKILL